MTLSYFLLMRYEYIIFNFLSVYLRSMFDKEFYFQSVLTVTELSKREDSLWTQFYRLPHKVMTL
jgi:hypothetical protein